MRKDILTPCFAGLFVVFFAWSVIAADLQKQPAVVDKSAKQEKPENWGEEQGSDIPILKESTEKQMDDMQEKATNLLLGSASWIDSFFDDDRSLDENNQTRATLKLAFGYSKDDEFEVKPRLNVRLQVPKLSEKAQIIISGSDDEDFDVEDNPLSKGTDHDNEDTSELTAALRYFLLQGEKYNVSFDTGVSWTYVFASLRYRAIREFGNWLARFTDRVKWYSDDGWENKAAIDLETYFNEQFFFRASTSAGVYEEKDGIPHGQIFKLFQVLSPLRAVSYEAGFYFGTEPEYSMTDAELVVKYRQRFYRDWLVFEIAPKINFPEDNDYEANPGIMFTFEATFGYEADKEGYKKIFKTN